jgi:putative flippase GtrA
MKDRIIHSRPVQWIAGLRISKKLQESPLLSRFFNYEFIAYLVVGVLTTAVNYVVFWIFSGLLGIPSSAVCNIIAFVFAVTFAYIANKIFVFDSPSWKSGVVWKEFVAFVGTRALSGAIETLIIWVTCDILGWNKFLMKVLTSIFVIIVNFFTSRFSFKIAGKLGKRKDETAKEPESGENETEEGSST